MTLRLVAAASLLFVVFSWDAHTAEQPTASSPEPSSASSGPPAGSVYLIGNSLTADTVPDELEGREEGLIAYHIDCGKPLTYILANPAEPCKKSSSLWPATLEERSFETLVMQTHYGTSFEDDIAAMSHWMRMQPQADVVVHTGWARQVQLADERAHTQRPDRMVHAEVWFDAVLQRLAAEFPGRRITRTRCTDALWMIADDVAAGRAPAEHLPNLEVMYRDAIHLDLAHGRFLMHNLMRAAVGQPLVQEWSKPIDPTLQAYLLEVVRRVTAATTSQPAADAE